MPSKKRSNVGIAFIQSVGEIKIIVEVEDTACVTRRVSLH